MIEANAGVISLVSLIVQPVCWYHIGYHAGVNGAFEPLRVAIAAMAHQALP